MLCERPRGSHVTPCGWQVQHRKATPVQSECVSDTPDSTADRLGAFVQETDCHHCSVARSVPSVSRRCRAVQQHKAHHAGVSTCVPTFSSCCFFSPPTFTHPLDDTIKEQTNHFHIGPDSSSLSFMEINFTSTKGPKGQQRHH